MSRQPTIDEWKDAYKLAAEIKEMAPWQWMYDLDNFGFEHPTTGEQGFVCVMGHEKEHFGITIYRGAESLFKVRHASEEFGADETAILEIEGVSLSFEDRKFLRDEDRQLIKNLNLKFRGRNAWPLFRGNRPACYPWFVDTDDLDFLMTGLERLREVAPLWKVTEKSEEFADMSEGDRYLMCIPTKKNGEIIWKQEIRKLEPVRAMEKGLSLDKAKLDSARDLPRTTNKFELSMTIMTEPIQDGPGERPYFCYFMIFVEADSGVIAGFDLASPKPDYKTAYSKLGPFLIDSLSKIQHIPGEIFVKRELHAIILEPIAAQLGFQLTVKPTLPRSEDALASFMDSQYR